MLTGLERSFLTLDSKGMTAGFSIVELMVALSVLGILFAVGIPAFGRLLQDIEIRGSAEGLRAALQTARTEAITRNTLIRFSLADVSGQPTWTMGCVHASARCPQRISAYSARADTKIRWGAAHSNDSVSLDVTLVAGNRLPSGVTFNALGAAPGVATSTDASRIDVIHSVNTQARRLVLMIAAAGTVRLCDPSAASDAVLRCN
jgi:type IV fimbrial biogenesis protein FimT